MIISIDGKRTSEKIQFSFVIKISSEQARNRIQFSYSEKGHLVECQQTIYLMMNVPILSFRIGTFLLELEKCKDVCSNNSVQHYTCIPSQDNKVRKIKDIQVEKETVMLSLFLGNMIM